MPAPLIAKVDRLAAGLDEPPAHFMDAVATLPGLVAAHFLGEGAEPRVGIWLWRGREGMEAGQAALAQAMTPQSKPPMIEERILDVLATDGDLSGAGAATAAVVHLGPFTSPAQREACIANLPRVERAMRSLQGLCGSLALSDPAGRDIVVVHLWGDTPPAQEAVRDAIAAEPLPEGLDAALLDDPSYVEILTVKQSVRPSVPA